MIKIRTQDEDLYINQTNITALRRPEKVIDKEGALVFYIGGAETGTRVKESPEQITLMIAACSWKPDTLHVEWEDKTNRPAVITCDRNFTHYVQKPPKEE